MQEANNVLIAVYGTLRKGERNHHYLKTADSIRACVFPGTLYDTGYGYPTVILEGDKPVTAELAEISLEAWRQVDRLEGYPSLYDRRLIDVVCGEETVQAWVYIMHRLPPQATLIASGDWKEHRTRVRNI